MDWRGIFCLFTIIGLTSMAFGFMLEETMTEKISIHILKTIARLGVVAKNKSFILLLLLFSLIQIPFLGFITSSSFIYVDGFGVKETTYSYYFAANAVFLLLGPIVYLRLSRILNYKTILTVGFTILALSGISVAIFGNSGATIFCVLLIPASLFANVLGPPRLSLMLEQVDTDTGSAVSLISSVQMIFGSIGMIVMPLVSGYRIQFLGASYFILGIISLVGWVVLTRKPYIRPLKD